MEGPAKTKNSCFYHLVTFACLMVSLATSSAYQGYNSQDAYFWNTTSAGYWKTGIELLVVDMTSVGSKIILEAKERSSSEYVALGVVTGDRSGVEPCTLGANRLLLHKEADPNANSAVLLCGNEAAPMHITQFPFKLTFVKGSREAASQLNVFNITFHRQSSSSSNLQKTLNASPYPGILYSPLYPDPYPNDMSWRLSLNVKKRHAVLFQVRFLQLEHTCLDKLSFTGGVDFHDVVACNTDLKTVLMKPRNYYSGISVLFEADESITGQGFELEYRSVTIGPDYGCAPGNSPTVNVDEATAVSVRVGHSQGKQSSGCSVIFKPARSTEVLVVTSLATASDWSRVCGNYTFHFLVDHKKLVEVVACDLATFGVIRAPPGQEVELIFQPTNPSKSFDLELDFVAEAYDPDALPAIVTALPQPSYLWIPGPPTDDDDDKSNDDNDRSLVVRSAEGHCVNFKLANTSIPRPLVNTLSLYSGWGKVGNFPLTENCFGKPRLDPTINSGRYRVSTLVPDGPWAFWINITEIGHTACEAPLTVIENTKVLDTDLTTFSLFGRLSISRRYDQDPEVTIYKHMSCHFVLHPRGNPPGISFLGRMDKHDGAELFVTEGQEEGAVMTNFQHEDGQNLYGWFHSAHTLHIYFRTGSEVTDVMAQFQYKKTYTGTSPYQVNPACPGPLEVTVPGEPYYTTPHHPDYLESNVTCRWRFRNPTINANIYIHVTISDVDLPCSSSTKLFIKGAKDSSSPDVESVCGVEEFYKVFPGDVEVVLIGGPDHVLPGIKFEVMMKGLDYQTKCNRSYEVTPGSNGLDLTGTLHVGHYIIPFICQIHLFSAGPDDQLMVVLNKVNIADAYITYDCYNDNGLTIYDGATASSSMLIHTCYNNGESVISSGNHVLVNIAVREEVDHPVSFSLSIQRSTNYACNGHTQTLTASSDSLYLTSPGYPNKYDSNSHCMWLIRSHSGMEVEIEIVDMDIEYSRTCSFDYIQVYDGLSAVYPLLGRVCGREGSDSSRPRYRSSNQVLLVRFVSDVGDEGRGFKIRYYTRLHPSTGLEDGGSSGSHTDDGSDDGGDDGNNNKTGVIIGACLSAIVGVFGVGFLCVWLVHKKRIRDMRNRQRRRRDRDMGFRRHSSGQESSVYVINPLIVNNAAPPPPYSGLINQGFLEEPPPSYRDALRQLSPLPPPPPPPITDMTPGRAPPPPYSVSTPRGHEAISEEAEPGYDSIQSLSHDRSSNNNNNNNNNSNGNVPIYETLSPLRRLASTDTPQQGLNQTPTSPPPPPPPPPPSSSNNPSESDYHLPEGDNSSSDLPRRGNNCAPLVPIPRGDDPTPTTYSLAREPRTTQPAPPPRTTTNTNTTTTTTTNTSDHPYSLATQPAPPPRTTTNTNTTTTTTTNTSDHPYSLAIQPPPTIETTFDGRASPYSTTTAPPSPPPPPNHDNNDNYYSDSNTARPHHHHHNHHQQQQQQQQQQRHHHGDRGGGSRHGEYNQAFEPDNNNHNDNNNDDYDNINYGGRRGRGRANAQQYTSSDMREPPRPDDDHSKYGQNEAEGSSNHGNNNGSYSNNNNRNHGNNLNGNHSNNNNRRRLMSEGDSSHPPSRDYHHTGSPPAYHSALTTAAGGGGGGEDNRNGTGRVRSASTSNNADGVWEGGPSSSRARNSVSPDSQAVKPRRDGSLGPL